MSNEEFESEMPEARMPSSSGKITPSANLPRRSSYQVIVGNSWRSISSGRSLSLGSELVARADCHLPEAPGLNNEAIERSVVFARALAFAGRGQIEALQQLLIESASLNLLQSSNRRGWRLLHVAAEAGQIHLVRWLLQAGCEGDQRDHRGWSALMFAASRNEHAVVQLLLINGFTNTSNQALRVAARYGALESIHALLSPSNVKCSDHSSKCQGRLCPVLLAAMHSHYECVQALIISGYPTDCLRSQMRDSILTEIVEHAEMARRVIVNGVKGVVVSRCSVLSDAKSAVKVKIELGYPGIVVRMRRSRAIFSRKKPKQPVLHRIGYDESVRMISHDAIALKMITVKINGKKGIRGAHVATALRHQQLQLSETFALNEETRALELANLMRVPQLLNERDQNQQILTSMLSSVTKTDWAVTERILPDVERLIKERRVLVAELTELWKRSVACTRMATQIAVIIAVKRSPSESLTQYPVGRYGARRLEREATYSDNLVRDADLVCVALGEHAGKRNQICSIEMRMDMEAAAIASAPIVEAPVDATTPSATLARSDSNQSMSATSMGSVAGATSSTDSVSACFKCATGEATVALDACRHLALCRSCGRSERSRRVMSCKTCHSQVDSIMREA